MPGFGKFGAHFAHLGASRNTSSGAPTIDMNFATAIYSGGTLGNLFSITRATQATDLTPSSTSGYVYNTFTNNALAISPTFGLLLYQGPGSTTNFLLNSAAPVTQTTGSLATGSYTLWVNGSGSAAVAAGTATGSGFGTSTNGTSVTFNVSVAGTVVVTVTGSLNAFQLENKPYGTSFIVTTGTTANRNDDQISIIGAASTTLKNAAASVVVQTNNTPSGVGCTMLGDSASSSQMQTAGTTAPRSYNGTNVFNGLLGSGSYTGVVKTGLAYDTGAATRSLTANNATATDNAGSANFSTTIFMGVNPGSASNAITIQRIKIWNSRLSDAALKAATQ